MSSVSAESVCATRSSMPRTCQSGPGPRKDNISAHHTAHAQIRRNLNTRSTINISRVLITVIMIMHFDLSAGFFHVFNVILEVNKLTGGPVASFTYIIISNGLESKILCLPNDQTMLDTRRNVLCHPHTQWSPT